jgi:hypothetical protein
MKESPDAFALKVIAFLDQPLPSEPPPVPLPLNDPPHPPQVIDCKKQKTSHLIGRFSSLQIINCSRLILENAVIDDLIVKNSNIHLISTTVNKGMTIHQSNLKVTGGHLKGTIAVYLEDSTGDFAGTLIEGSPHAIAVKGNVRLLMSATFINTAQYNGVVHDLIPIKDGEAF